MKATNPVIQEYQLKNNVDSHWGGRADDWLHIDRILLESLGISEVSDDVIIAIERDFQLESMKGPFEKMTEDALLTIRTLHKRGYPLGICTRRPVNPVSFLIQSGVRDLFETVQWSGVIGYSKPNPYTLLNGAKELGINPKRCAFVGNYVNADVEAAIRCDMLPVLLTWANPDEGPKAPEGTLIFEKASDILQVFTSPSDEASVG
ncbi:MAG: HAD family hydrolase [Candidatus Thorarchaeota archaeon]|jgi:phosphoglycolate phosphatase-like HAD superfamily hydrolase